MPEIPCPGPDCPICKYVAEQKREAQEGLINLLRRFAAALFSAGVKMHQEVYCEGTDCFDFEEDEMEDFIQQYVKGGPADGG